MSLTLVTGGTGFVGSNLVRRLAERGEPVRCLVRDPARADSLRALGAELVRGSLADADSLGSAVRGADVVFHVAGRTTALGPHQFQADNVEGTRRLVAACAAQTTPPTTVFVSSLAAGGPGVLAAPRREDDPPVPVSHYGRSKLAAEETLRQYADAVPLSIIRPPMIIGPGDHASLALYRSLRWLPFHLTPGLRRFPLSILDVNDLCDALELVAARGERLPARGDGDPGRGRYHATTDRPITYGELGRLAGEAAQLAAAPLPTPKLAFWLVGAIGEALGRARGTPLLINLDKVREATAKGWVCDDQKLRLQLGYAPSATLETRFAEAVAWYRRQGWL